MKLHRILRPVLTALTWALVLAAAGLPAVFLNTLYGYLPVLTLLTALAISIFCLLRLRRGISVEASSASVQCERGGSVNLGLRIVNRSRFFCPKASAALVLSDLFGQAGSTRRIPFTMAGGARVEFSFGVDMSHIGVYSVGLEYVELWDFFGAIRCRVPLSGRFQALVRPRRYPIEDLLLSDQRTAEANFDTRTTVVGGTDYTGVREYALGDPMKQIHWKLSAHSMSYMTKLQESSRQREIAVILDFAANPNPDREQLMDLNDRLVETALSLLEEVSRRDAACSLLYCNRARTVVRTAPAGREDDLALVQSFSVITPDPGADYPDACRILCQEGQAQNRATNTLVVTSRVTAELLQELGRVKRQRRSPELYLVVPAEWNSRELEQARAPLRQLEAQAIPYSIISTARPFS